LGMAVVLLVLQPLFDSPDALGVVLFASWAGGYGTAAAMGDAFAASNPEKASLGFTAATVGVTIGIVGGLIQARVAARKGHVQAFTSINQLPKQDRTGLIEEPSKREPIGLHTFTGSSIESLGFHASMVVMIAAAAYGLSVAIPDVWPTLTMPVFVLACLTGLVVRAALSKARVDTFVDNNGLRSISGIGLYILIVSVITSSQPQLVAEFGLDLLLWLVFGLILILFLGLWVAPRRMQDGWFERSVFVWGWASGAVSTGIAL